MRYDGAWKTEDSSAEMIDVVIRGNDLIDPGDDRCQVAGAQSSVDGVFRQTTFDELVTSHVSALACGEIEYVPGD